MDDTVLGIGGEQKLSNELYSLRNYTVVVVVEKVLQMKNSHLELSLQITHSYDCVEIVNLINCHFDKIYLSRCAKCLPINVQALP